MNIERRFFKIAHIVMMTLATLALLCTIAAVLYGIKLNAKHIDKTVTPPTVTLEELKKSKALLKQSEIAPPSPAQPQAEPDVEVPLLETPMIPHEYEQIIEDITKSLSRFATKTRQPTLKEVVSVNIYKRTKKLSGYIPPQTVLTSLLQEVKALELEADRIAKIPKTDDEHIEWYTFLSFFFDTQEASITRQLKAIEEAERKAAEDREFSKMVFAVAGGSFSSFIFFTIILLLFSIDNNIYALRCITQNTTKEQGA